jgi:hypothetical protein
VITVSLSHHDRGAPTRELRFSTTENDFSEEKLRDSVELDFDKILVSNLP